MKFTKHGSIDAIDTSGIQIRYAPGTCNRREAYVLQVAHEGCVERTMDVPDQTVKTIKKPGRHWTRLSSRLSLSWLNTCLCGSSGSRPLEIDDIPPTPSEKPSGISLTSPYMITSYHAGVGSLNRATTLSSANPAVKGLMEKLIRFRLPETGMSCTINFEDCGSDGIAILRKALKKSRLDTGDLSADSSAESDDGELVVGGWCVYLDWGQPDAINDKALTEAQLVAFCNSSSDDPARAHTLSFRRATQPKRCTALYSTFGIPVLSNLPPARSILKLRNFFGPLPGEPVTDVLAEQHLHSVEKIVVDRTTEQSTMSNANALGLQKRDAIPLNAPADRSNISIVLHKEGEGNARNKLTNHYPKKNIVSRQDDVITGWIKGTLVGSGSFGAVYLGMNTATGLLMAVKQASLPTTAEAHNERKNGVLCALMREIEFIKEFQHQNIVQYLASSVDNEHLSMFLEYAPGGSVAVLLKNYGAFEEALARTIIRQVLNGLQYLHGRGVIHRDIRAKNLLMTSDAVVKITGFDMATKVGEVDALGGHGAVTGSVFWMAPEAIKGKSCNHKADIWSLGCLVVEMCTGEHPWAQLSQMQAIFKIGSGAKPVAPKDISPEADAFLKLTFELEHEARPDACDLAKHAWILTG